MAFTKPTKLLHDLHPSLARARHTNKMEVLSPGLMISYSDNNGARIGYPTVAQKNLLINGAAAARRIMRTAVAEMDRVVFFRRPEGQAFTNIMNYHFGLAANRANPTLVDNIVDKPFSLRAIAHKDRRSILNQIRMGMLSISFHINTGVYLIDVDNGVRAGAGAGVEGYVNGPADLTGLFSAFKNGEIHVAFAACQANGYTAEAVARVIIHEAAHKYWGVEDQHYAHNLAPYRQHDADLSLDNADSFAWAALSLDQGQLIHGVNSMDLHQQLAPIP